MPKQPSTTDTTTAKKPMGLGPPDHPTTTVTTTTTTTTSTSTTTTQTTQTVLTPESIGNPDHPR